MPNVEFAKKAVVKVPQRSAFDKSFRNLLTTKCGTLTPICVDEVIPNTTVNMKLAISATLPPLASETFMNVNLKVEAFFCPHRLVMKGFEQFIQGNDDVIYGATEAAGTASKVRVPLMKVTSSTASSFGAGTLADYLGFRTTPVSDNYINLLPFLHYHNLWDKWYRNPLVQKSCFVGDSFVPNSLTWTPNRCMLSIPNSTAGYTTTPTALMADGVYVSALRQRNFGSDYFTTATPSPQNGEAQKITMSLPQEGILRYASISADTPVQVSSGVFAPMDLATTADAANGKDGDIRVEGLVDSSGNYPLTTSFTIASLRACNSLQQWLERNQLSNNKYVDFLKAQYNANLKDSIAQRPIYLGSASFPVYSKGIYQTAKDSSSSNNPFDSVGSRYGHAYSEGSSFIIDHYTAEEPGYIFVLASLVPEVTYSSGINKYLMRYTEVSSYGDLANGILQNVGPEPIRCYEFDNSFNDDDSFGVFGYTDRYASWMTRNHELHGLLRDGQSLDAFALQRSGLSDGIGSTFLTIPTNYMDQVTAVDSSISTYGCWIDSYFDYKVVMPLAKYSIPSLQDPAYEHGESVAVNRRGRIIE